MCGANESMIQHMENRRVLGILGTHKEEVTAGCLLVFFGFYVLLPGYFQAHFSVARGQLLTTRSKGRPPGKALVFSLPIRPR